MVMKNNTQKYMTRIGQNTGTSNIEKKVMRKDIPVPRKDANQNLNSGNFLVNGLYSFPSEADVGNVGAESSSRFIPLGSSSGERKAMKLLRRKIPRPYATMKYP